MNSNEKLCDVVKKLKSLRSSSKSMGNDYCMGFDFCLMHFDSLSKGENPFLIEINGLTIIEKFFDDSEKKEEE